MELFIRRHKMSPIIISIIFFTFFHNVLSRHRIRHFKDRFKRQQGAHLYLPGSYITDGGEGPDIGPWTEWSAPSPCSRSCGGGVASQTRACEFGYLCQGPTTRYFSCNTQDCPEKADFREQQCSEYDTQLFEGIYYEWVPYTKAPNPCELNCMPKGERFYFRHAVSVVDGTRCSDENYDVCVNGTCQAVGCDRMLGSSAREDQCRICNGDGSTCNTVENLVPMDNMQVGYNDILLIPAGATNIRVEEVSPTNNYLAVRNTSGHYYLNGNWRIDFPRTIEFAGCRFKYDRYPQGFAAPDVITCLGPTDEPLFIVLLYQDPGAPVKYTYSLPTNLPIPSTETYSWTYDEFTPCSATCGGGWQFRNVTCAGRNTLEPVDRELCDSNNEPEEKRRCNEIACEAQWVPHPWKECSAPCGEGGTQIRDIFCQQIISNGQPTLADDAECLKSQPKPPTEQKCNVGKVCAKWFTGPWKPCDHLCGDGKQTRDVQCYIKKENKIDVLEESECEAIEPKPEVEKKCNVRPCEGVDWITSEWSGCDRICGLKNETRKVFCATASEKVYPDELCEAETKPELVRKCEKSNATCQYLWYASQWSECSATCGAGVQTRTLFCGVITEEGVKKVENDKCDPSRHFETIRNCTGEQKECEGEWFSGPWGECSKPCGGGERSKKVVCIKDYQVVDPSACGSDKIVFSQEDCNTQPCSEDSIIPTDVTQDVDESEPTTQTDKTDTTLKDASDDTKETEYTDVFEISTEASTDVPKKESEDDEYEIVPDTNCDDGEWVDVEDQKEGVARKVRQTGLLILEEHVGDEVIYVSDDKSTGSETETTDTLETGSGDGESSTSPETTETSFPTSSDTFSTDEGSGMTSDDDTGPTITGESSSTSPYTTSSDDLITISTSSGLTSEMTTDASLSTVEVSTSQSSEETDITNAFSESDSTESTLSTEVKSTVSNTITSTELTESTESSLSTESSESTESSLFTTTEIGESKLSTVGGSTEYSTTEITGASRMKSESTGSTVSDSTDETVATTESSGSTTESGTSESPGSTTGFNGSTTEFTGSTTEFASSTTEFTGSTTEFTGSTTEHTGSTTEFIGSTTEFASSTTELTGSSTEFTGSTTELTGSTTEFSGSTTEFTGSTSEISTVSGGSTESDVFDTRSTTEVTMESTPYEGTSTIMDIFKKPRMCKRRKIKTCLKTKYGCCWDNITPAQGPFDKGCPNPKTCKEAKYGCCEDGVSAALGPKYRGCPSSHCNETLFGCCPDNETIANGNDFEGCPPKCASSVFGCCDDNVTEATGPDHEGCKEMEITTSEPEEFTTMETTTSSSETEEESSTLETLSTTMSPTEDCNNTTYRCCPDGITPAEGPGFQGCNLPCSNSSFGCCPDANTAAHGPSGEGCCLSSPFGCCPDNIVPARGLNMEGCDCEHSPYGCCPDNKTAARGYNSEGCGCQYTRHGCCPDNFTPAEGPDFYGCLCHTFQFGCCPDGITTARGPHQQGCGCRNTQFGCCTDEQTPAKGLNMEGCGCESSRFGCCLDGVTTANGENFEGCDSMPLNPQVGCSMTKERGTCRNYTVKWFFDMQYGGCSRFWYGGCDGNDNRYKTKEECEQICVNPVGKEVCNLPKVAGPCEGYYPQWYYDKEQKQCLQFIFGGCLGNNNRFETREECMGLCATDNSVDACEQRKEEGPCRGQFLRYYFNEDSEKCEPFYYGGCKGNNNNFASIESCQLKCTAPGRLKDHCSLPRAQGNCTDRIPKWYYDTPEKRCIPFYYSGCNGNQNNFETKEACHSDCPPEIAKDTCQLPAETGDCANYVDRWYYDTREKTCRQFYYGGCGGNGNNFETQQRCQERCEQRSVNQTQPEPATVGLQTQPNVDLQTTPTSQEPFTPDMCFLPSETGRCRASFVRYFYDRTDGVCKGFTYGGCDGNRNNFESIEQCLQHCGAAQDLCTLPPIVGPCSGEYIQYYYEQSNDTCLPFNFGGCGGNYNRFQDQASCEQRCRKAPPSVAPATQAPPVPSEIRMCYQPVDPGNCTERNIAFFYDIEKRACTSFIYTGCGGNENRFNSEEQCERQCGMFRGQDICNIDRDPGLCRGYFVKYYYDKSNGRCDQFAYGGCGGNGNRFSSAEECEHICVTHDERKPNITSTAICQLPIDQGPCEGGYHKRWYFDDERGECIAFIYSGCGGNFNNFKSFQSCIEFCKDLLPQTEPPIPVLTDKPPHPCQEVFDECTTLRCAYGVEPFVDENECHRCRCRDPCINVECSEDERCAIDINRNRTSAKDAEFIAICRKQNKPGQCPFLEQSEDGYCEEECKTDADCTLHLKCCSTGCGTSCVDPTPGQLITQQPQPVFTEEPIEAAYQPPRTDPQVYEPEVHALIGDQAILRCAVSGNPNPQIKWSKDNTIIDGTQPRYRIKLDQSLQIITLHKTDSGIYLCTADNGIGDPITNEIRLNVLDSDPRPVTILDQNDEPPVIVSLNAPTTLNCFVLGYPLPSVTWWKDDSMIPFNNNEFEVRQDFSLLIHSVKLQNLGIYTCQAYNGYGKAASWAVTVRARGPYHFNKPEELIYKQFIVNPPEEPGSPTEASTTTTTPVPPLIYPPFRPTPEPWLPSQIFTEPSNEIVPDPFVEGGGVATPSIIVPVRANITTNDQKYPVGSDIDVNCAVIGYPVPQVQWYKDGVALHNSERIRISDSNMLTILSATKSDSGDYQCEATNAYSRASSTLEILVEGMYIHPSCTDNQFFANCRLIVKANYCTHKYYAKFCCRSCTEAGLLPVDGPHLHKQNAIDSNLI